MDVSTASALSLCRPTLGTSVICLLLTMAVVDLTEGATVSFDTLSTKAYLLEKTIDLKNWSPASEQIDGNGSRAVVQTSTTNSVEFFRVQVLSPFTFDHLSIDTAADMEDLRSGFDPGNWRVTAKEVLKRTFTDAWWIVENDSDPNFFYFWFGGEMSDFTQMMYRLSAAVHETVHHVGFARISFQNGQFVHALALGENTFFSIPEMGLFPRSEILAALPPELQTADYANTYLTGQSGGQDVVNLLDEFNAYTFSALVDATVVNQLTGLSGSSSRDGVLTFMLYTETYLNLARENYTADYDKMLNSDIPDLIVLLWDRAESALAISKGDPRLGQQDALIRTYVYEPARLNEVERLRARVLPRVEIEAGG